MLLPYNDAGSFSKGAVGRHSQRLATQGELLTGRKDGKRRRVVRSVASFWSRLNSNVDDSNNRGSSDRASTSDIESLNNKLQYLEDENKSLLHKISDLELEKEKLRISYAQQRIILENFEGDGSAIIGENGEVLDSTWWEDDLLKATNEARIGSESVMSPSDEECLIYDDDACPIEPDVSFQDALRDRAYWLVGLLALQSMSGFILARNEELLQTHPFIVYFLTMLVGAGGNAGNQASVRVIRGIALGTLNERTQKQFLNRELKMAISLSAILAFAGFIRAYIFRTPFAETVAVTTALALIVFSSICLGAILPLILKYLKIDPAHSSTTIQVIMDILGVVLTVLVSTTILDSPIGQIVLSKLSIR